MKHSITAAAAAAAAFGLAAIPGAANAQEPFIGEIRAFPYAGSGGWCPRGWAHTNGDLMAISENTTLFSLLGTAFGGDGRTTFGLPDLRGRAAVGTGTGPGLSPVALGEMTGSQEVTLGVGNLPSHSHSGSIVASDAGPDTGLAADASLATFPATQTLYATGGNLSVTMEDGTVETDPTGGGQPVVTLDPFLGMNFCIATMGLYPSRN